MSSLEISGWLLVFLLSPHQLTYVTCFCMVTLATTFIPINKFLNLQLALSFRVKDLMVLLFPMTNDLIFSCVECIIYYHGYVYLLLFFEGKGRGKFSFGLSLSLYLEGPKVGLGRVSLCIYVCFLYNSCYIYVVYLLSRRKKILRQIIKKLPDV